MNCRIHPRFMLSILLMILIILALGSANMGALTLSFRTLWHASLDDAMWHIWLNIRLPRVLLAVVVGCALAVSGAIMQGYSATHWQTPVCWGSAVAQPCVSG